MPKIGKESTKQRAKMTRSKVAMKEAIQKTISTKVSEPVHVMFSTFPGWELVSFLVIWGMSKLLHLAVVPARKSMQCKWGSVPAFARFCQRQRSYSPTLHSVYNVQCRRCCDVQSLGHTSYTPSPQPRAMTRVSPD